MAFGRNAFWVKIGRPGQLTLPIITDLAAFPVTDTSIQLSYFPNVPFYQYRIGGGTATALSSDTFTGLTASTLYTFEIRGGYFSIGPWSGWSNVASATTLPVPDASIGSIANLTAVVLGQTSVQLAFANATNAASYQYRLNGGTATALNAQRTVTGLTANTGYDFEVRGANAAVTIFGAWSNLVHATTNPVVVGGGFDPINYLTAGEKAQLLTAYSISTIPFTRVWGLAGEPSCPYREPAYDTNGSSIPANALDISAYGGNVGTWLAAMETQGKPGKAGSGTYSAAGLVTRGTQSIYGYGATRPIFNGEWKHYVQADNCRFQYLKRTNSEFWLIMQDDHSAWMTASWYGYSYFEGAAAQYKRLAAHTGFYMLDCAFDNVYWAAVGYHFNYRTKKFHVGRNTYRNGCKIIATFHSRMFGDAVVNGVNGIYWYGNDLDVAAHDPSGNGHFGSTHGTVGGVLGYEADQVALRPTNGPDFFENNRVTNIIGCGLPKTNQNVAVVAHMTESNLHYERYNEIENVYTNLYSVDTQAFYAKGTVFIEENYARGFGACSGQMGNGSFTQGMQSYDGWVTNEFPGSEGAFCTLKGGNTGISTIKNNILIPMWHDIPVLHSGHKTEISGNYVFNYKGKGLENTRTGLIRTAHPGFSSQIGTNYFVGCGQHPYNNRRPQWLFTTQGGGATVANATDDVLDLVVNYDSDRRDIFYQIDQITNSFNSAAQSLQKQTVFPPSCSLRPTMIRSGGNFVINSNGTWHLGPTDYVAGTVPLTYEWYRDGVIIGGQTASSMSESQWTGTIEGVVVGTLNGKTTRAACIPIHKIVSELVPAGPASFTDSSATVAVTQDYALGTLTTSSWYRFTFTQNVDLSTVVCAKLTGTGGTPIRPGVIHRNSRAGSYVYEFQAQAGENNLRFVTEAASVVTISNISCGKITGSPVMGQAW